MSKADVLSELPRLTRAELVEVQAKLDELIGDGWEPDADLADADKAALDVALRAYGQDPNGGSSWQDVEARLRARFGTRCPMWCSKARPKRTSIRRPSNTTGSEMACGKSSSPKSPSQFDGRPRIQNHFRAFVGDLTSDAC